MKPARPRRAAAESAHPASGVRAILARSVLAEDGASTQIVPHVEARCTRRATNVLLQPVHYQVPAVRGRSQRGLSPPQERHDGRAATRLSVRYCTPENHRPLDVSLFNASVKCGALVRGIIDRCARAETRGRSFGYCHCPRLAARGQEGEKGGLMDRLLVLYACKLSFEACQAVTRAFARRRAVGRIQASQGKRAGRSQIAYAMLVVDGECLQCFAGGIPRAEWDIQQLAPACSCCIVAPTGPPRGRQRAECIDSNRGRLRIRASNGSWSSCARMPRPRDLQPAAGIDPSERQRFARVAASPGPPP